MEISNIYDWKNSSDRKNNTLLPNSIRGVICGKSNCGKTSLLMTLLLNKDYLI